ncbi:MAG: glutamate-ammonia-ligase adenylyltransferase [bacterium]|nr:glutamate-ammonia-ligase adenylyltransferase [bacterium]
MSTTSPTLRALQQLCPDVPPALIHEHLTRLAPRYFEIFSPREIAQHLQVLARLSPATPVDALVSESSAGLEVTVLAFDYPYEFSLITGILASLDFSVRAGDVFTYSAVRIAPDCSLSSQSSDPLIARRRIVDRFLGTLRQPRPLPAWAAELRARLLDVITLVERGGRDAYDRARQRVNEFVAQHLASSVVDTRAVLYPVHIDIDNETTCTRLRVSSQDTPAFLYTLANALALHDIRIEYVAINTEGSHVHDELLVTDRTGNKIEDPAQLDQIKLSVLLTKQFTYFLTQAPDPYTALCRFEQLVASTLRAPTRGQWLEVLSNPHALQELARVLRASDFLWEDFIRQQYETLLPMLAPHVLGRTFTQPPETIRPRLQDALAGAASLDEQLARLNDFKDREIYLIDLDHIVSPTFDFRRFSAHLTALAEEVVRTATQCVYSDLIRQFGIPRTAAGCEARFAILGLGKFGGAALGYASDIELLFIYSDNGQTDRDPPLTNIEFFQRLAQQVSLGIRAKRDGIFRIDLRLRPYGTAGPLAASLEQFCRYYGPGGPAHSYERLALVRLRAVGGDPELGRQLERLRDEFVYQTRAIDLAELRALRRKQFEEMTQGRVNAKFSPGALVDLEYDVQILQVMHGATHPELRTPRIHAALEALAHTGVLSATEAAQLSAAYDFLRRLINALRMLRGSAKDLFLPPLDSPEFLHLARRMGYQHSDDLSPAQRLHLDFETHTAIVRAFVERHFGRDALPRASAGTVADVVLSDHADAPFHRQLLAAAGFHDPATAARNLRALAGPEPSRSLFARLAILAADTLRSKPDPDMALNNWERFVARLPHREEHFQLLLAQPARLDILLSIFAGSQFLADTLVQSPEWFEWVTDPAVLRPLRTADAVRADLLVTCTPPSPRDQWRAAIRHARRRELLRIATRDLWLGAPLHETVAEISAVAEAICAATLDHCWLYISPSIKSLDGVDEPARHLCLLAFGKLGGYELNYSSDVDLLALSDDVPFTVHYHDGRTKSHKEFYQSVLEQLRADLSTHTEHGYAYRVDFRLRPYGLSGELVPSVTSALAYYRHHAALWELQAALKLRPIAGARCIGEYFLNALRPLLTEPHAPADVVASISRLRQLAVQQSSSSPHDVKNGPGGIRDIEFLVQGLQLIHAHSHPDLLDPNTLNALARLHHAGILPSTLAAQLADDYAFLRRLEHFLQLYEDRQTHALPTEPHALATLARRVSGPSADADSFLTDLTHRMARVRQTYLDYLAPTHP